MRVVVGSVPVLVLVVVAAAVPLPVVASEAVRLELELGGAWQERNDFAIPGDSGTLVRLPDDGPTATWRATVYWDLGERWTLRLLAAPLSVDSSLEPTTPVDFEGETFAAGERIDVEYEFNSYRVGAFYRWPERGRWSLAAGATLKVRDARIALSGAGSAAEKTDVGVVPLAYGAARYRVSEGFSLLAELDALAGPQGRAIDLGLRGELALGESAAAFLGYRLVEGGADNDEVYSFAAFHSAVAGLTWRF